MRAMLGAIAMGLAVAVSGCIAVYSEPAAGDTASLTVVNTSTLPLEVLIYGEAVGCRDRQRLPSIFAGMQDTTRIVAGRDFALTLIGDPRGSMVGTVCRPTIRFSPKAARNYVLVYQSAGDGGCRYGMFEGQADNLDEATPVPFVEKEWRTAMGESGPWCRG